MTSRSTEPPAASGARGLLGAPAVRRAAERLLDIASGGALGDWSVDLGRLPAAADFVADVVRERYPTLAVPVHSRWRHFMLGDRDLGAELCGAARAGPPAAIARTAFDLVIMSVLLDAGAGPLWSFRDPASGAVASRSEGLGLASLRWFQAGGLSADPDDPLRADAAELRCVDGRVLEAVFQAGVANPLVGLEGRAALLNRLGAVMQARPDLFASADTPRPGGLFDVLAARAAGGPLPAAEILGVLLEALGPIWAGRPVLDGVPLGDCWPHPALAGRQPEDGYAPLHKLSQWLAYSLIEPLEHAGIPVVAVDGLTGLAEYRNGGLCVDMGLLRPRDERAFGRMHAVADPFVVAWRSLTVALLDRLAPLVSSRLGRTPHEFPLARVLEGGTWAAGRLLARKLRADGGPPFQVSSDGTVF